MDQQALKGMLDIAVEADVFAQGYAHLGLDAQSFMHELWIERGMLQLTNPQTIDWKYRSYQDLVLDLSQDGPRRVPIYVPEHIGLMEAQMCFSNAYQLALDNEDLTYVEGFAQTRLLIVKHAWVEEPDGTIIDPTWGNFDEPKATYFGIKFSDELIMRHSIETGYTSILDGDWRLDYAALRNGFITDEHGLVVDMEGLE